MDYSRSLVTLNKMEAPLSAKVWTTEEMLEVFDKQRAESFISGILYHKKRYGKYPDFKKTLDKYSKVIFGGDLSLEKNKVLCHQILLDLILDCTFSIDADGGIFIADREKARSYMWNGKLSDE